MDAFLVRLQQRKLVQWSLAYLAAAWLLLQLLDVLGQNLEWPHSVFRIALVLLAAGFLAALVVAWFHGERGAQNVTGIELVILAGILLLSGIWLVWMRGSAGLPAPAAGSAAAAGTPGDVAPGSARSLAVLPFKNLSASTEDEYFSDGITEEILNALANLGGLRVISRTSVMRYKHSTEPASRIATELGVTHLLEGSVSTGGTGSASASSWSTRARRRSSGRSSTIGRWTTSSRCRARLPGWS